MATFDISDLVNLTTKDLDVFNSTLLESPSKKQLHEWLTREINLLINNDFNKLLNVLYRIDISETKSKEAFAVKDPNEIGRNLADLIIEREIQKIESRKKYNDQK